VNEELQDWPAEPAERAKLVVERMLDELELEGDLEVQEDEERIDLSVESDEDLGLLIGRRGQTIDALQLLCYQAAYRGREDRKRVVVDAAGYRDRRRETLAARAESAAERALSTGDGIEMDPMSPQERRVVHEHLKDRPGVETYSEGDEPQRFVVVAPIIAE
jgi:spoIIIJ-associated protein